ncbi:hypothetical protein O181_047779 [Austropuccinia psidii MF-1]|uniref:Uncharacterized protein n=1 Tax=Austropuccinia psidii MF-1 TaxID=1389203 RepID=A0A9Q3DRP5_9BASI|nr:hypothetical protein [Austropuccinia psidii MF-1]
MPIQHSPPARHTRSQARPQAVLTPTPRAPLDSTPAVPQLRTYNGRRSTIQEGRKRAKQIQLIFRSSWRFSRTFKDQPQGTRRPAPAQYDQPVSHQSEPSLLAIMQQMTQIMANLQTASSS